MRVFDFLAIMNPSIDPKEIKVHLATRGSSEHPLDLYRIDVGKFEEWQRWQTRKNFERKFVLSLITMPGQHRWLFAGVYYSSGAKPKMWKGHKYNYYELTEDQSYKEMNGRLVATFPRPGRQAYLNAERWSDKIVLSEVRAEPLSIDEFPGYKSVNITKDMLELIVQKSPESWRTTLSSIPGIYLISDAESGKPYVGSASGEEGIWQRWSDYADNGHGGNDELKKLIADKGPEYVKNFRYSILEIIDVYASPDEIHRRESHWKDILMSRTHGWNRN